MQKNSVRLYRKGKITMRKAAMDANLSIWEMEQYLVRHGYKSQYSVEDLQHEMGLLSKAKNLKK
jgi:predicted HTH domain antitoxin